MKLGWVNVDENAGEHNCLSLMFSALGASTSAQSAQGVSENSYQRALEDGSSGKDGYNKCFDFFDSHPLRGISCRPDW
jgi:hypothetical protein